MSRLRSALKVPSEGSRLRSALAKYPDKGAAVRAIGENFKADFEQRTALSIQHLSAYFDQALYSLWPRVLEMIRQEVTAQMPVIPPPQILQPIQQITQVVSAPVKADVEIEIQESEPEDDLLPMSVKRDASGRISSVVKGDIRYRVIRNADGFITRVEPEVKA
jgi:hypothetical protein